MLGQPLKLAFIGGGVNSAVGYTHLIASQMDHRWELVSACFSRNTEINKATASQWNLHDIRLHDDWKSLVEKEVGQVDAVAVLTPTPTHFEIVSRSLELGIPVICEKALTTSHQEGLKLCEAVETSSGFLAVTHNYTGYPMLREIRSMIIQGELGRLINIAIEMPQEGFIRVDKDGKCMAPQAWRLQDGVIPSVSLDLGAHLQHMIYFLSNEDPLAVVADQASFGHFKEVVDDVSCMARYKSGMKSQMWFGKSAIGHRNGLKVRVYGTKGSAEWFQMEPEIARVYSVDGNQMVLDRASDVAVASMPRYNRFKSGHPAGFIEAFANLYLDIAETYLDYRQHRNLDSEWIYGCRRAVKGLAVLEAMAGSSQAHEWVNPEDL
ncbi:MAG: Gfo/Idh/MocA family oxidoreductase [Candidatus Thiodiazotropha sp.]